MIIEDIAPKPTNRSIKLIDIPVGQVFTGELGDNRGPFLRGYVVVVDLRNPSATWMDLHVVARNYIARDAKVVLL